MFCWLFRCGSCPNCNRSADTNVMTEFVLPYPGHRCIVTFFDSYPIQRSSWYYHFWLRRFIISLVTDTGSSISPTSDRLSSCSNLLFPVVSRHPIYISVLCNLASALFYRLLCLIIKFSFRRFCKEVGQQHEIGWREISKHFYLIKMKVFLNRRYFASISVWSHLLKLFIDSLDCVIFKMIILLPLNKHNCLS